MTEGVDFDWLECIWVGLVRIMIGRSSFEYEFFFVKNGRAFWR